MPALAIGSLEVDSVVTREIAEVSVVARREADLAPVQRLNGARLDLLNACSVADAVRYFAGVQIKDYGGVGGLKTVDIRSMGSNHLGVFYDGLPIGNAQNGTVDLGRFSLDNMEEVSVYNGQKANIFQSARDFGSSGTVYLQTRRPHFHGNQRHNVSAKLSGGSFGLLNASALYEQRLSQTVSLSANAEYTHATGRYKFEYHKVLEDASGNIITAWDTTGTRQNGDVEALRIECSTFGQLSGGRWHAKVYYYDSERGIPRAIVRNVWTSSQRQWNKNFFVQANVEKSFAERSQHMLSAKYSRDYLRYLNPDTTQLYVDNRFTQHALYVSLANCVHLLRMWDCSVSCDHELNWMTSDMAQFANPRRNTTLVSLASSLSSRFLSAQASLLLNDVHDATTVFTRQSGHFHHRTSRLTPAAFVNVSPLFSSDGCMKNLKLRTFFKKMFRMPTFNDLYYTDLGNISLKPEYATQYNVGISFLTTVGRLTGNVQTDVYHNIIDNKIVAVPKGNSQYRWMMMNIGKVDIKGLDANAQLDYKSPLVNLNVNLCYTFQKALDMTDPADDGPRGTYGGQISYIPRHSGSVILNAIHDSWSLSYSFIYVGERYHVSSNIPENYEPSWYTHDVRISKGFIVGGSHEVNINLEVNNILDQHYDVVLNYPMPGRNFKGTIKLAI